jgi:uncharacterized protein YhbP (UPF0306 family)
MSDDDTRAAIGAFLAAHSTLTLSTVGPAGQPMAASLFFAANPELRLFWLSSPTSRHSQNLARQSAVAVTVHNETWTWSDIAGVQMEGQALMVPAGDAWQAAWRLYRAKFPFVAELRAEVTKSNFYVFSPVWMRLIDNSRGFGNKVEIGTNS